MSPQLIDLCCELVKRKMREVYPEPSFPALPFEDMDAWRKYEAYRDSWLKRMDEQE